MNAPLPKFPFVTSNNKQGFLIKILYKLTWRVRRRFHVLLLKREVVLANGTKEFVHVGGRTLIPCSM